ncbi:hypothetical protein Vadar_004151 [Vaccinium darrowii]|uniref:Uncharacterized protein n=1 Tax=Vaccinium darrowii TaxID=229202 RepID=A0ACB7XN32_9ERIC|nr:hypothetical protein Vadar_004151 [Vaccinium darrowii]
MRALYFAITLLPWVFGPIPMFVSSVVMVVVLYKLDWNTTTLLPFPRAKEPGIVTQFEHGMAAVCKAVGQEMTTVISAVEHHGRP